MHVYVVRRMNARSADLGFTRWEVRGVFSTYENARAYVDRDASEPLRWGCDGAREYDESGADNGKSGNALVAYIVTPCELDAPAPLA